MRFLLALILLAPALAGCLSPGRDDDAATPSASAPAGTSSTPAACMVQARASFNGTAPTSARGSGEVTLLTHDSFSVPAEVLAQFTDATGYAVRVVKMGDAGEALNKAILTKGAPVGDVLFGVDNALIHRAKAAGLFEPYVSRNLSGVEDRFAAPFCDGGKLLATPVDYGYVQLNHDPAWFQERGLALPTDLKDVANATYAPLTVVESPRTSSPGFAFLLATVDRFGTQGSYTYESFWRDFEANGGRVATGWEEAYGEDFTQGWSDSGARDRPIVLSYSTSPAFNPMMGYSENATSGNLDLPKGAWFQVEAAGILKGAKNPEGAQALLDFLLSPAYQEPAAAAMVVYPVHRDAKAPEAYALYAPEPKEPATLAPEVIDAGRDAWLQGWSRATGQV